MPKARNSKKFTRKKQNFKQKRLLRARLIRISMVIDDYVYKDKVISTSDANMYIEEVSKFKLHCLDDARSLQVIEKITRCMNAVIAEAQENAKIVNFQSTASETYCPSPVYSLPEEDKEMLSQTSVNLNQNMENEVNDINDLNTIDLCSDDDDATVQTNVWVDVEIHRAMSNLSIRGNEDVNIIDCSQSILNDFNANREKEIQNSTFPNRAPAKVSKTNVFMMRNTLNQTENIDCSQSILADFNPHPKNPAKNTTNRLKAEKSNMESDKSNEVINTDNSSPKKMCISKGSLKVHFKDNVETTDISKDDKAKITKKPRKKNLGNKAQKKNTGSLQKNTKCNNDKAVKRKKKTGINIKASTRGDIKTSTCDKSDMNISSNGMTMTNDILTLPLQEINTTMNETVNQKVQSNICGLNKVNNSIYSKSMGKIYNANIENDLSWIENIRYVREICTEEFDSKLTVTDTFWENFTFPGNWDENYFD